MSEKKERTFAQKHGSKIAFGALMGVPFVCMGGLGAWAMLDPPPVGGTNHNPVESRGAPYGELTVVPKQCFSGRREGFFGVWLVPEGVEYQGFQSFETGLRLAKAQDGSWEVHLRSSAGDLQKVLQEHCSTFRVSVRNTDTYVSTDNPEKRLAGIAELRCEHPEGGTLSADLVFQGCR